MVLVRTRFTGIRLASLLAVVALVAAGCGTETGGASPSSSASASAESARRAAPVGGADSQPAIARATALASAVHLDTAMTHLQRWQDIAHRNGGNRALGTPGYEQSIEYAESVLRAAGYSPRRQQFDTTQWTSTRSEAQVDGVPLTVAALLSPAALHTRRTVR